MKENLKILVIAFSIILNLVFIGTTAFHRLSSHAATGRMPEGNCPFLYQKLNLSSEQLARIEPVRDMFHERLGNLGGEIKAKQLELIDLLAARQLDRKAVDAVQERITQLQKKTQDTIISHIVEETGIFSPEQRESFFGLIRERIIQSSESCPPWMRPSHGRN
jgi:Spy/CpxP family protein refolding chaperone